MQRRAWRAGRLGTEMRKRLHRPKESNHIDRVFRFALHLHRGGSTNTIVSGKTKLHYCETMSMYIVLDVDKKMTWTDERKNICPKSSLADLHETIHGTACGMYAMYLKQFSSYGCPSWLAFLETLAKQQANQTDGVTVSTTVEFVTDSGGDQDKMLHIARDVSTHNVFLLLCASPCLLHVRRLFVRDFVLQDERSDEVLECGRQDETLLA